VLAAFGLSAGVLATGPVQRVYTSETPPTPKERRVAVIMGGLMAKIRKCLERDKKS
jgi:hypothetical protein